MQRGLQKLRPLVQNSCPFLWKVRDGLSVKYTVLPSLVSTLVTICLVQSSHWKGATVPPKVQHPRQVWQSESLQALLPT